MASVPISTQFRNAVAEEVRVLEELQRRTALVSRYREQILAHPDAIEIPLPAVVAGHARVVLVANRIVGFSMSAKPAARRMPSAAC